MCKEYCENHLKFHYQWNNLLKLPLGPCADVPTETTLRGSSQPTSPPSPAPDTGTCKAFLSLLHLQGSWKLSVSIPTAFTLIEALMNSALLYRNSLLSCSHFFLSPSLCPVFPQLQINYPTH